VKKKKRKEVVSYTVMELNMEVIWDGWLWNDLDKERLG